MPLVLIIDDDPAMRILMAKLVESAGHNTLTAEGGYQGLESFTRNTPDLVITDLSMPGGEGGELIAEIRHLAPSAKILAVSGGIYADESGPVSGKPRPPADAVLSKPFRSREFCAAVDQLLS